MSECACYECPYVDFSCTDYPCNFCESRKFKIPRYTLYRDDAVFKEIADEYAAKIQADVFVTLLRHSEQLYWAWKLTVINRKLKEKTDGL